MHRQDRSEIMFRCLGFRAALATGVLVASSITSTTSFPFTPNTVGTRRRPNGGCFSVSNGSPFQRRSGRGVRTVVWVGNNNNGDDVLNNVGGGTAKITSALARLDSEWQTRQKKTPKKLGEWRKLVIRPDDAVENSSSSEEEDDEFVYLLPPTSTSAPSVVILFVGGAGLGQFPHIAYDEMLRRLAVRTNAAVLAAPYQVSLDHFDLARRTRLLLEKSLLQCDDDFGWDAASLHKYALGHSLGAKLQLVSAAASSPALPCDARGLGLVAYNNFGLSGSLSMARTLFEEFRGGVAKNVGAFDTVLGIAGQFLDASGLEFTPSPSQTEELVRRKLDVDRLRAFRFDDDQLDCSDSLRFGEDDDGADQLEVAGLPGSHLTPVFLTLGLEDLDLDENVRSVADAASDGFRRASLGSEDELDGLVEELYGWIVGKSATRGPSVNGKGGRSDDNAGRGRMSIAGAVFDAEIE